MEIPGVRGLCGRSGACNSSVYGRAYHEENGNLHTINPFAREKNRLVITILEGEELVRTEEEAQALAGKEE